MVRITGVSGLIALGIQIFILNPLKTDPSEEYSESD